MSEQPNALRLADALNRAVQQEAPDDDVICVARWFVEESAAELRRLHSELEAMTHCAKNHDVSRTKYLLLNQELLEALNAMLTHMGMDEDEWNKPTFDQARAAIAKGETK